MLEGDSHETKVLVKASRAYSPIFEYRPHLLLLTVFLVGLACLQYRNLHVPQCMMWLVEVGRYRKVIIFKTLIIGPAPGLMNP